MNISKREQRVLHVLAQGGAIRHERRTGTKVSAILCLTRDGLILSDCDLDLFGRLRRRGLIGSQGGQPYRITRRGLAAVRGQLDNQCPPRARL